MAPGKARIMPVLLQLMRRTRALLPKEAALIKPSDDFLDERMAVTTRFLYEFQPFYVGKGQATIFLQIFS